MEYKLYQLDFFNGVRFGKGNLDHTEITFHADTLFSALFQESMKLDCEKEFLAEIQKGNLRFSDAFPYIGKHYYIPKPMIQINTEKNTTQGDSKEKKLLKNLKYIPQECLEAFVNGEFPREHMEDMKNIGSSALKVSVGIRGNDEPEPYRVSAYYFKEGSGLYILLGYNSKENLNLFEELLNSLSYSGLGGKKSAGLGRFEYMRREVPEDMKKRLSVKGVRNMLLSTALPEDEEMENALEDSSYLILRRGGFVDSATYAEQQMRKKELYVFAPGSCFKNTFNGKVITEHNGGTHPVFRYECALFMGVNV